LAKPDLLRDRAEPIWCAAGEAIASGDICYINDYTGGVRVLVKAAANTAKHATGDLLVAEHDVASGVRSVFYPWLVLTGLDTSGFTQGDPLYLSDTAGGYSDAAGTNSRVVGQVLKVHATEGVVVLTGAAGGNAVAAEAQDTYADQLVVATIAVTPVPASNDAPLTLALFQARDGATALGSARQALIMTSDTQYLVVQEAVVFSAATLGTIIATGFGWALIQTTATGAFACTASHGNDVTVYFSVETAQGVSDITKRCSVVGSNVDTATWTA
jgi:hypothetical protein